MAVIFSDIDVNERMSTNITDNRRRLAAPSFAFRIWSTPINLKYPFGTNFDIILNVCFSSLLYDFLMITEQQMTKIMAKSKLMAIIEAATIKKMISICCDACRSCSKVFFKSVEKVEKDDKIVLNKSMTELVEEDGVKFLNAKSSFTKSGSMGRRTGSNKSVPTWIICFGMSIELLAPVVIFKADVYTLANIGPKVLAVLVLNKDAIVAPEVALEDTPEYKYCKS
mmetsp:Transcript_6741/g.9793  ORF Transcript_6741/g.9793 Transcript_6741/m.9793 type:complete len:225 (-) Transcript_6741:934-1608(-)